jgi:acetyl-CoA carboxylase alpha subunit
VSTSLSPEEIRAAAEIHRELGPEYQDAVVASFVDRVGREIDARVESRLAAVQQAGQPARQQNRLALPITSIALGVPLSGIALGLSSANQLAGLALIWVAIAVINVAYALGFRTRH